MRLLLLLPLVLLAGCGEEKSANERIFVENCGACHTFQKAGTNGQVGPNLNQTPLSAAAIEKVIKNGRRGAMPAFSDKLSPAEIRRLSLYIKEVN